MIDKCFATKRNSESEIRTLKQAVLYGLTSAKAIACECFGTDKIDERTDDVIARLLSESLICEFSITCKTRVFLPTPAGHALLCEPKPVHDRRTSFRSLVSGIAMLNFCCVMNEHCQLTRREDIKRLLPGLDRMGAPGSQYIKSVKVARIFGIAKIDFGGSGNWEHIVRKTVAKAHQLVEIPDYLRLAKAKRFELTVLTAMPEKARKINLRFAEYGETTPVRMQAVPIPDLLPLVAPLLC